MIVNSEKGFYLCDEKNELYIGHNPIYKKLEGIELGSYEFLFNEAMLFTWTRRTMEVKPTSELLNNSQAWVRDIKIDNLFNDDITDG